jgi:hypothetical protein
MERPVLGPAPTGPVRSPLGICITSFLWIWNEEIRINQKAIISVVNPEIRICFLNFSFVTIFTDP